MLYDSNIQFSLSVECLLDTSLVYSQIFDQFHMFKIYVGFYETITNKETLEHSLTTSIEILRVTQTLRTYIFRECVMAWYTKSFYVMIEA